MKKIIHTRLRFFIIVALMVSLFLNAGFLLDNQINLNDHRRNSSSSSSNTADTGLISLGGTTYIAEGNFRGAGNPLFAKQYGQLEGTHQELVTNASFQMDCADWNGTAVQIEVSQMEASGSTVGELQMLETKTLPAEGIETSGYTQEFQIPFANSYLTSVTPYLRISKYYNNQDDLLVEIWNATDIGGIKPDQRIFPQYSFDFGNGAPSAKDTWFPLIFATPVLLKSSQTVGNIYIILLSVRMGQRVHKLVWGK